MNKPYFNHHFYPKMILTPISIARFELRGGVAIKCLYLFGVRIARWNVSIN